VRLESGQLPREPDGKNSDLTWLKMTTHWQTDKPCPSCGKAMVATSWRHHCNDCDAWYWNEQDDHHRRG
jgi:hypothetical protein